jgi:signal-transduction protein with cAMP-binding, CBS, and nucleotidyltransferase domain
MRVSELCVREVEVVSPKESAAEAARRMHARGVGTLIVVDDLTRPLGIVTDRDLMARCIADPNDPERTPVDCVMSGPVAWVHEGTGIEAALDEMARLRVRRLAVVDARERLVGLVALDDVLACEHADGTPIGRALRATMAP